MSAEQPAGRGGCRRGCTEGVPGTSVHESGRRPHLAETDFPPPFWRHSTLAVRKRERGGEVVYLAQLKLHLVPHHCSLRPQGQCSCTAVICDLAKIYLYPHRCPALSDVASRRRTTGTGFACFLFSFLCPVLFSSPSWSWRAFRRQPPPPSLCRPGNLVVVFRPLTRGQRRPVWTSRMRPHAILHWLSRVPAAVKGNVCRVLTYREV